MTPGQVAEENVLTGTGKPPFHLKMTFQTFDVSGKPSVDGSLEYWWAGAEGSRWKSQLLLSAQSQTQDRKARQLTSSLARTT